MSSYLARMQVSRPTDRLQRNDIQGHKPEYRRPLVAGGFFMREQMKTLLLFFLRLFCDICAEETNVGKHTNHNAGRGCGLWHLLEVRLL